MFEVYLQYDEEGRLLYVGMTGQGYDKRLVGHRAEKKEWLPLIADYETRAYPTRDRAYAVEQRAIRWLKPKYNKRIPLSPSEKLTASISTGFALPVGSRIGSLPASALSDLWGRIRPILEPLTDEELDQLADAWTRILCNRRSI